MQQRVLVIPDKFKGTLTSQQAAAAIAAGWKKGRPRDKVETAPMSDGGDGFGRVLSDLLRAKPMMVMTLDAAHRPCRATWWYQPLTRTAIIESANIVGLAMLPPGRYHPFELDTFGLASIFKRALDAGAKRCYIGIGGSATNDGGFGLARGLGWKFLNDRREEITSPFHLHLLRSIEKPVGYATRCRLIVAVDVTNPLLGPLGCSRVFGPQKGLRAPDMRHAETCLRRLAEITSRVVGKDFRDDIGAGAAGGLGFGLMAFLGAKSVGGFQLFSRAAKLSARLKRADLVITGEGALDASSVMGKAAGSLAAMCRRRKIPCLALAGKIKEKEKVAGYFRFVGALVDMTSEAEARKNPARWLEKLAEKTARQSDAAGGETAPVVPKTQYPLRELKG